MQTKPSRPQRVKNNLPQPVSDPIQEETLADAKKENAYARRTHFIAKPTLGRAITVETVGLGNLKVITANGVQSDV